MEKSQFGQTKSFFIQTSNSEQIVMTNGKISRFYQIKLLKNFSGATKLSVDKCYI